MAAIVPTRVRTILNTRRSTIAVEASGPQALACMDAIEALLADKFGEEA